MCNSNPQTEKMTVWGFTEEEIEHRWEVHQKFDPINRLRGSSSDSDSGADTPARNAPEVNPDNMLSTLEQLLTPGE